MQKDLTVGTRVRLAHPVDRYPHFIAPEGATGVVVEYGERMVRVRLDEPLEGAEDWENEVHWFDEDDMASALSQDLEVLDIELQTGSEFMVSGCYGLSERGTDFIDGWNPNPYTEFTVVDAGKIVIPDDCIEGFSATAKDAGLNIVKTEAQV